MKKLILLLVLMCSLLKAQTPLVTPQVINAAGGVHTLTNNFSVTDNVGEPFTTTIGNGAFITQGFIQPEVLVVPEFTVSIFKTDVTCSNKNDGKISTALEFTTSLQYNVQYVWTPTINCPNANCSGIDSLRAGTYSLIAIFTYTNLSKKEVKYTDSTFFKKPLVISDVNGPCKIKVFSGITLNGDGINDFLFIENISEFPANRLSIYNRWGAQLYDKNGYDNITNFWPTTDEANKLVPSTYFYILDLGDGSKPLKGWIELIKN